jgi:acyl-[acyl-carrier-protein] desaturase
MIDLKIHRQEVMLELAKFLPDWISKYLKPIDTNWQPTDFLPDVNSDDFYLKVEEIKELCAQMEYDLFVTLIGDTITEEALPTYESWLMGLSGVNQGERDGWATWIRSWTAEENRHGDLLNKYLYLSGRVNMREMEVSTQYLIRDGFDIQTGNDPYSNFVYTSFQELATNVSHRRVASLSKKTGNNLLAKICGQIAADEARHATAYSIFVQKIFELDPSQMMLAFEQMMKKKIVMPAHFMRESGGKINELFAHFSDAAQRVNVYTSQDYISILKSLISEWKIDKIDSLNDSAEKARDYILRLPDRLEKLADRMSIPSEPYKFKWVAVR